MFANRERRVEKPWFKARELEIRSADCTKPQPGAGRGVRPLTYLVHAVTRTLGKNSKGLVSYRGKQRSTVTKMSVGGVRNNADLAGYFTQHDGIRAASSGELQTRFNQGISDPPGPPLSRPWATPTRPWVSR